MLNLYKHIKILTACCLMMVSASACGNIPQKNTDNLDTDPLCGYNRAMFAFNEGFDKILLRPVTSGYRYVMPEEGRHMVSNFLDNLYTPVIFANSVLQGDPQNSFASLWRFILNSTLGGAGLFDFASASGLHNRPADFGETLAMYGVDSGPYVVLPILGPSNIRDGVGRLTDAFLTPTNYASNSVSYSIWGATAIDIRSRNMSLIDSIYKDSLDPYSTMKSLYEQKRAADIRKAKASRQKSLKKALEKSLANQ